LPHLSSALAGAAMTTLAKPLPFIASDAAVAFCFFSAIGKEIGPRGYERKRNFTAIVLLKKRSSLTCRRAGFGMTWF